MTESSWETKAARKREFLINSIPKEWIIPSISPSTVPCALDFPFHQYLSPSEMEITGLSAVELLGRISKGQYKAVEVARAFAHRAAISHQLVNCCIEFFWDAVEKQAMELDDFYRKHGRVIGPLHGLPISLKGAFLVLGI
jgi:amidase